MDGGFPYGDVIVIAAIAAFILLRYRAMLGEPRGRDENTARGRVVPSSEFERVIQLPLGRRQATPEKKEEDLNATYGSLAEQFVAMREVDREFAVDEFMSGARMAYEMVITAFSKRDRETLQSLLSPTVYEGFERSLSEAESSQRFTDTTLVAITKATITEADLQGNQATITVDFVSEQVHLIRDGQGAVLEGDVSQQNLVEDQWVFTRDMTSTSPNWTIIET